MLRRVGKDAWATRSGRRCDPERTADHEQARLYRGAVLDRNRAMIAAVWPRAVQGDREATRIILDLHRELRDVLGLDTGKNTPSVDEPGNKDGLHVEEALARLWTDRSDPAASHVTRRGPVSKRRSARRASE